MEALEDYGLHLKKFDLIGQLQRRLFNYGQYTNIFIYITHNKFLSDSHQAGASGKLENAYSCLIVLSCLNFEKKKKKHKQNK